MWRQSKVCPRRIWIEVAFFTKSNSYRKLYEPVDEQNGIGSKNMGKNKLVLVLMV